MSDVGFYPLVLHSPIRNPKSAIGYMRSLFRTYQRGISELFQLRLATTSLLAMTFFTDSPCSIHLCITEDSPFTISVRFHLSDAIIAFLSQHFYHPFCIDNRFSLMAVIEHDDGLFDKTAYPLYIGYKRLQFFFCVEIIISFRN